MFNFPTTSTTQIDQISKDENNVDERKMMNGIKSKSTVNSILLVYVSMSFDSLISWDTSFSRILNKMIP